MPWLLKAGHSPADAEVWLAQFPSWTAADPAHLDLFSHVFAERWRSRAQAPDSPEWVALPTSPGDGPNTGEVRDDLLSTTRTSSRLPQVRRSVRLPSGRGYGTAEARLRS